MSHLGFEFLPLGEDDLPLLSEWLGRPHLSPWWREEDTRLEAIRETYLPRERRQCDACAYIAVLNEVPIGYIQYYIASLGDPDWWPDRPGPGVLGIDQFLADEEQLGRGLGTIMVREFVEELMKDPSVTEIRVDPHPDNARAIRCYEKVGFEARGEIATPDGPALMMVLPRPG